MADFYNKIWGIENIEVSDLKRVIAWNPEKIINIMTWKDLYILWWKKKNKTKRAWNSEVLSKCYFFFDLDIRKDYETLHKKILSQDELNQEITKLKSILDSDSYLKEWSYIINSWNGCHIYYCWKTLIVWEDITVKEYSDWVKKVYEVFNDMIKTQYKQYWYFIPDIACSNIARTSRAPMSINHKKKYWMWDLTVEVLFSQDIESKLVALLPQLWKEEKVYPKKQRNCWRTRSKKSGWYKNIDVGRFKIWEVIKAYTGKDATKKNINCPFPNHTDKEPSFRACAKRNICKCFTCDIWWNPANFVRHLKWISYWEALRELDKNF